MQARNLDELATIDVEYMPLDQIALLVALEKYPKLPVAEYLARLDEFAERAEVRIRNVQGGRQAIEAFNRYLFEEEGFQGNSSDYYNPSNSYLNDVMDHRSGIPITLSILYIEIGRRIGLPLSGVNFPGHFLVRYDFKNESFYIDPFHGGTILTEAECRKKLATMYAGQLAFKPEFLEPATKRQILIRMLANLKIIYTSRKEFEMALVFLNKLLLFDPETTEVLKERGMIYYHLECFQSALKDFESYLVKGFHLPDRPLIERCVEELRGKVGLLH